MTGHVRPDIKRARAFASVSLALMRNLLVYMCGAGTTEAVIVFSRCDKQMLTASDAGLYVCSVITRVVICTNLLRIQFPSVIHTRIYLCASGEARVYRRTSVKLNIALHAYIKTANSYPRVNP